LQEVITMILKVCRKWWLLQLISFFVSILLRSATRAYDVPSTIDEDVGSPYMAPSLIEQPDSQPSYTAFDDASFAINSRDISDRLGSNRSRHYEDFMNGCRRAAGSKSAAFRYCEAEDNWRMQMNTYQPRSVYNYTRTGFLKLKAPSRVFRIINEFWQRNKDQAILEWAMPTPYHNNWEAPPTILRVDNQSLAGGGPRLQAGK
jgi:hypothetical protein